MRHLLIAAAAMMLAATVTAAAPLTLGVRAGSSIPNLRDRGGNELSSGGSSRVAPYAAMSAGWPLGGRLSLQAEVAYAAQGGQKNGLQPVTDPRVTLLAGSTVYARFDDDARLDDIEIPLPLPDVDLGAITDTKSDLHTFTGACRRASAPRGAPASARSRSTCAPASGSRGSSEIARTART